MPDQIMLPSLPGFNSTLAYLSIVAFFCGAFVFGHIRSGTSINRHRNVILFILVWLFFSAAQTWFVGHTPNPATAQAIGFPVLLIVTSIAAFSAYGRRWAVGLPLAFLIGIQALRLPLEVVLHSWYSEGFLPVQMTYLGSNFDIVTGLLAIPVAILCYFRQALLWPVWLFNIIGTFLLFRIILIVSLSSSTPLAAIFGRYETGPEVLLGTYVPFSWIAWVIVAFALFSHIVIFRKLLARN